MNKPILPLHSSEHVRLPRRQNLNSNSPLKNHPLNLFIFIDQPHRTSGLRFLIHLENSMRFMDFINVNPYVFLSSDHQKAESISRKYRFEFPMIADSDHEISKHFSCIINKEVFGVNRQVFRPCLLLLDQDQILCQFRQANAGILRNILEKAIRIQFQVLEKALSQSFDKKNSNW